MSFPNTPYTLISRLKASEPKSLNDSWREFLVYYRPALEESVKACFARYNWTKAAPCLIDETLAEVVVSFSNLQRNKPFNSDMGKLSTLLRQIVKYRVIDQIRKRKRDNEHDSISAADDGDEISSRSILDQVDLDRWEENETRAYQRALLAAILANVRELVSPRTFLIFDQVKLQHNDPETVAKEFGIARSVVDNSVYKVMKKLKELAQNPDYKKEILE